MSGDLEFLRRAFRDVPNCRIATVGAEGAPYVASRWFVWPDEGMHVATRRGDTTWSNVARDPRVSIVVDRGRDWTDLGGVRVDGVAEALAPDDPRLRAIMSAWHEKYRSMLAGEGFELMTGQIVELAFLRVRSTAVDAWEHHPT